MAWTDIRTAIVAVLAGISVTTPSAKSIKKVYATPPGTVQELPCFIVFPPRVDVDRGAAQRRKLYTVRCILLITDADLDVAADFADAFREATIDAFDGDVKLGTVPGVGVLFGQTVEGAAAFNYAGRDYTGFECRLSLNVTEARTFTP